MSNKDEWEEEAGDKPVDRKKVILKFLDEHLSAIDDSRNVRQAGGGEGARTCPAEPGQGRGRGNHDPA